ncbi:MAG: patatin-like phospholipase family protein [Acidobacteriota bacterium]
MASFKLGINMAGAISAGAYTAGVLDFLTEALDAWYAAKARGEIVPQHDVVIEVFSGASAGGMCAAISAVLLQQDFEHIHDVEKSGTTNRLFESWVNKIDIQQLLTTEDLAKNSSVISLLDSSIIDEIAEYALAAGDTANVSRPYVSPQLTLFLSLTNLRGVPYSLNGEAPGSVEESTFFYGDHIRFETVPSSATPTSSRTAYPINLSVPGEAGGWTLLQQAAKATGAFPVFLAPRSILRKQEEYTPPMWESVTSAVNDTPPPTKPNFPMKLSNPFETLNVDGGVTNNDPFNYAHDYLLSLSPKQNAPTGAEDTDRAVFSIAPFPTTEEYSEQFDSAKNSNVFIALSKLFSALISQSRFFGESLNQIMSGTTFSRFVIAPSDDELAEQYAKNPDAQPPALQCASLGAFGGFRAHDYALGRRNCQKFLRDHFVLPEDNVVIKSGIDESHRQEIRSRFGRPALGTYAGTAGADGSSQNPLQDSGAAEKRWIPVIPLCSENVLQPVPTPKRTTISDAKIRLISKLIGKRVRAIVAIWRAQIPSWPLRIFLWPGGWIIPWLAERPVRNTLEKQLRERLK